MTDKLSRDLFTNARDQYLFSRRWTAILLGVAMVFHLTIFTPYLGLKTQESVTAQDIVSLETVQEEAAGIQALLSGLQNTSAAKLEALLKKFVQGLRDDFVCLERARNVMLLEGSESDSEFFPGSFQGPQGQQIQMQAFDPLDLNRFCTDYELLPEDVKIAFKNIRNNRADLIEAISDFVNADLIGPRYQELNQGWRQDILPHVETSLGSVIDQTGALAAYSQLSGEDLSVLQSALLALLNNYVAMVFVPPEDTQWWTTVPGKGAVSLGIADKAAAMLQEPESLKKLNREIEAALQDQQALSETIKQNLEAVKEQAASYQETMASLAKPLGFFALDHEKGVVYFSVLLALLFSLSLAWRVLRLRELAFAISLQGDTADVPILWQWFMGRSHVWGNKPDAWDATRRLYHWQCLGAGGLVFFWAGIAQWQIENSVLENTMSWWILLPILIGIIGLGLLFSWKVFETICQLIPDESEKQKSP